MSRGRLVDIFCGGGGASQGIFLGTGRHPDDAVNHDEFAIAVHEVNHQETRHHHGDVWHYAPRSITEGDDVDFLWASPTCIYFSKAKGGPLDRKVATKVRALAWVVRRWAQEVRPHVICVENVEAFQQWGPLLNDGKPCPRRKGQTFRKWVRDLEQLGYQVEWRELRACDYGSPTSRKRLFVIARCDGQPIVWPTPTHGKGLLPYRSAASCIDWSIPVPSIFGRRKALADATLRRIARGVQKFVLTAAEPFVIPTRHGGDARVHNIHEPLRTITASNRGELALVAPTLIHQSNGERKGQEPRIYDIRKPLSTVVAGGVKHALVATFLTKNFGGNVGPGADLRDPMSTITTRDHHALVTATSFGDRREDVRAFLTKFYGTSTGQSLQLPFHSVTTNHHFGLVTVHGERFQIADIGMRLLVPRELYRAQGFDDDYVIDRGANGRRISKTRQIRMVGNSVPPQVVAAIVRANLGGQEAIAA